MSQKLTYFSLLILISMSMAFCQNNYDDKLQSIYRHTVPLIHCDSLEQLVHTDPSLVLLDTRSKKEFDISHIQRAKLLDYDHFNIREIKKIPKKAHIVVYCSVGYRSERIGEQLLNTGYKKVNNLYGGIFQWKNEGREVIDDKGMPTDSVHTYNKSWSKWLVKGVKVY